MASIVFSILGIVVCGGIGAVGGWLLATGIGLVGVPAALWVAGTALLRARGLIQ